MLSVDYGQVAPRIAYGLAGQTPPDGDLYAVPGLEGQREGVKKVMTSMLNVDGKRGKKPRGTKKLLPTNKTIEQIQVLILDYHKGIAPVLNTDIGQTLTLIESEIMIEILMDLKAQGIVALPVHDCIIIREQDRDIVTEMMMRKFKEVVGIEAVVKCESKDDVK